MSYTESEKQILRDANLGHIVDAAENIVRPGELKAFKRINAVGREVIEFIGDKSVWMGQFRAQPQLQLFISNGNLTTQQALAKRNEMIAGLGLGGK
jgi:hypothetical protein